MTSFITNYAYLDTDTKVGSFKLAPNFADQLERFYAKASAVDRAKCLELLTALKLSEAARGTAAAATKAEGNNCKPRRPASAMASSNQHNSKPNMDFRSPYLTSYNRDYEVRSIRETSARRPGTTERAFRPAYPLGGCIGSTTYGEEYYQKQQEKTKPIRTGSTSGVRRNNPHPPEAFMVWKMPRSPVQEQTYSEWSGKLDEESLDRVMRGQLSSTYREAFLGRQPGHEIKRDEKDAAQDWYAKVPYTINTTTRQMFQAPRQQEELSGNTRRYGCNRDKRLAARGPVPLCSTQQMAMAATTTYDREFIEPKEKNTIDVRDVAKELVKENKPGKTHLAVACQSLSAESGSAKYESQAMQIRVSSGRSSRSRRSTINGIKPCVPLSTKLYSSDSVLMDPGTVHDPL